MNKRIKLYGLVYHYDEELDLLHLECTDAQCRGIPEQRREGRVGTSGGCFCRTCPKCHRRFISDNPRPPHKGSCSWQGWLPPYQIADASSLLFFG